jgi:hypothetical protein
VRSCKQTLAALCTAALLGAPTSPAWASGPEEDAKTFFAQGREFRSSGKYAEAVIAFRRALDIYPEGLGSLRNIAECEESLSLFASARRDWWDLRRAALQSTEAKYQGWEQDAEARYRALANKVAKLTIKVTGRTLDRVRVLVDGKPVDPRLVGVELERDLGLHTIEAFYGGAAPVSRKVDLRSGAQTVVVLDIPPEHAGTQATKKSGATLVPTTTAPPPSGMRTAGFVALGVGGAGAVATAIAIGIRTGALSGIEDGCPKYETEMCPHTLEGNYNTGRTASTLVNVFGGVAIAGAGAGIVLLVIGSSEPATEPAPTGSPSASLQLTSTLRGGVARLGVRF